MVWMTAAEALDMLNVRPQTLYANVSRGKIRAKADDNDPRRSLYHRDDVLRMARRANGRRKVETVSTQTMQYGDPVLPSSISTIADGRLLYRGHDAATLADNASLEDIAALLWEGKPAEIRHTEPAANGSPLEAGLLALPAAAHKMRHRWAVRSMNCGRKRPAYSQHWSMRWWAASQGTSANASLAHGTPTHTKT
jgi:citrate synthase